MMDFIPKPLLSQFISMFLLFLAIGFVLSIVVDNIIILIAVLFLVFILLCLMFYRFYIQYIKPINAVTDAVDKIINGNYKVRVHPNSSEAIGQLSNKINQLARDLTDLSIQEQMQSEQLSTLIDNTESGLVLLDEKGFIHLINPKFISMFGKQEKDYIGYLYYEVIPNEIIHETVQNVFLYERNIKESFQHDIASEKKYIEIVGAPIINERKMLKGAVLVLYDITELKKLENMRKDFVANVSHELRTPITSIKGFSETILDGDLSDTETVSEFLKIIYNESYRLQLIIEDLLELSRLESDRFQLVLHKLNAKELTDEILPSLEYKADKKNIGLIVNVDQGIEFKGDKENITQIIVNLIDNAINYTKENGQVGLTINMTDDYVHILVSDTGIGIEQDELSRIFERFYRVEKARSRNTGGTGLGLAIVKHIVEVHNGKIEIESEPNEGTNVHVYLPK